MRVTRSFIKWQIWIPAPEFSGVKKTGGLADAVSGLSEAFAKLGHSVTIIMPKHVGTIEFFLKPGREKPQEFLDLIVPIGSYPTPAKIYRSEMPVPDAAERLEFLLIDTADFSAFSSRRQLYNEPDDASRFLFFDRAVHELYCYFLKDRTWHDRLPDIVHCHDWQTGFIPFLFNLFGPLDTAVRSIYNIHNLGYSCGERNLDLATLAQKIGVPLQSDPRLFSHEGIEFYGRVEPHKAAILFADKVITVSPDYAEELRTGRTDAPGNLYAGVLQQRGDDFDGRLNGLPSQFTPQHFYEKGILPASFTPEDLSGRRANREALQDSLNLPKNPQAMIITWTSRLAHQKGIDIALQALPHILANQPTTQFICIADSENQQYVQNLQKLAGSFPDRVRYKPFDEALEIRALAGGDLVWIPSRFEPCGLNQMKGQKLGCAPWVRETGGLKSTVRHYATGFSFWELSPETMTRVFLKDIFPAYRVRPFWRQMIEQMMRLDYSWTKQAQGYIDKFEEALSAPRRRWPF